jgi:hypothetical protein
MKCSAAIRRPDFQERLIGLNAAWTGFDATALPDGDADLDQLDFSGFTVPSSASRGGVLKPDVVFFGESVPREQVALALQNLEAPTSRPPVMVNRFRGSRIAP